MDAGQPAPVEPPDDAQVGPARPCRHRQRQVLPPGLVGRGALCGEVALQALALQTGIVVLDLVVVPHDQPRAGGVGGLQRGVALVLRVAVAVAVQRARRPAAVQAHGAGAGGVFVDVIAEEDHQVQRLGGQVTPRGPVAVVPALAARDGEAQRRHLGVGRRCGARASRSALLAQRAEAVPVGPRGLQPRGLGVHAVRPGGLRSETAARSDAREAFVVRDFPAHRHLVGQVGAGQSRPQHHAVGPRLARGHAQPEARHVGRERVPQPHG